MNTPIITSILLDVNPADLQTMLGEKLRALRLYHGYKRTTLSKKSGVSPETIRNFERSGKINLENFLKIAFVLGESRQLQSLFDLPEIASLSDIEARQKPSPKRGRR